MPLKKLKNLRADAVNLPIQIEASRFLSPMPVLRTSRDFRSVQNLEFCYICGDYFVAGDVVNRDHVPPSAVFLKEDRHPALWLPAHAMCNTRQSKGDEPMGQLINLMHGKVAREARHARLQFDIERALVTNVPIDHQVVRWIRGMHAALYREPLAFPLRIALTTPFAEFDPVTEQPAPIRPEHTAAVFEIKRNRKAGRLDSITGRNDKFIYECVWGLNYEGRWACIFAMNLYDWKNLGGTVHAPVRGCAGCYYLPDGSRPEGAAVGTKLHMPVMNSDILDPFGC